GIGDRPRPDQGWPDNGAHGSALRCRFPGRIALQELIDFALELGVTLIDVRLQGGDIGARRRIHFRLDSYVQPTAAHRFTAGPWIEGARNDRLALVKNGGLVVALDVIGARGSVDNAATTSRCVAANS